VAATIPNLPNPRLEVPTLVHEGQTIFDSTIILEYLEETFPAPRMTPSTPAARARMRMIEEICDTHWEAINWGAGRGAVLSARGNDPGSSPSESYADQLEHIYAWLETALGNSEWLTGDRFGWGDLSIFPFAAMSAMFGIDPPSGSAATRWLQRASKERRSAASSMRRSPRFRGWTPFDTHVRR